MDDKIALISVVYNNYSVLQDFFSSLAKQTNQNFHLFLVDLSQKKQPINSSAVSNHQLTLISGNNLGYAYGVNLGLKQAVEAGFKNFCILNNDIFFKENFTNAVSASLLHHPSSLLGGKIYYAPGFEYHKGRYQKTDLGKVLWYAGGSVDWANALTPHRGVDQVDNNQYNQLEPTEFINGCLMGFDKQVIDKVGFWDEKYFLYFEDADFCERAKRAGIKLYYDPAIVIWHKNAQSTGGSGSRLHQYYQKKSQLRFGLAYAPLKTKLHLLKNYFLKRS